VEAARSSSDQSRALCARGFLWSAAPPTVENQLQLSHAGCAQQSWYTLHIDQQSTDLVGADAPGHIQCRCLIWEIQCGDVRPEKFPETSCIRVQICDHLRMPDTSCASFAHTNLHSDTFDWGICSSGSGMTRLEKNVRNERLRQSRCLLKLSGDCCGSSWKVV